MLKKLSGIMFFWVIVAGMISSCATSGEKISEPLQYFEVVEIQNILQADLYTKVNMWFIDAFKDANSVIQFTDKEAGVIKGKYVGNNIIAGTYICKITSIITVEIKDGKYRVLFTDPTYQYIGNVLGGAPYTNGATGPVVTVDMANKVKEEWLTLCESLKSTVLVEATSW
jgi:hypothetical protein